MLSLECTENTHEEMNVETTSKHVPNPIGAIQNGLSKNATNLDCEWDDVRRGLEEERKREDKEEREGRSAPVAKLKVLVFRDGQRVEEGGRHTGNEPVVRLERKSSE